MNFSEHHIERAKPTNGQTVCVFAAILSFWCGALILFGAKKMKSFYSYLKSKSKQQSPVGDFARDTIRASQEHPCIKKYGPIGLWLFIKNKYPVCDEAFFALSEASKEYGYRDFFIKFYDIQSAIDDCNFPVHPQLIEGFLSNAPAYLEGQVALVYDAYWLEKSTVKEFVKSFLK